MSSINVALKGTQVIYKNGPIVNHTVYYNKRLTWCYLFSHHQIGIRPRFVKFKHSKQQRFGDMQSVEDIVSIFVIENVICIISILQKNKCGYYSVNTMFTEVEDKQELHQIHYHSYDICR